MTNDIAFWDKIAKRYAARPVRDESAYEQTLEHTRNYLRETDRVLELGCGTGTSALKLAGAVGHITGSDGSAAMIGIARDKANKAGTGNVDFIRLDLPGGTPPQPGYDAILAFNLLHLIPDTDAALAMAHRNLEPGGHFISKSVCLAEKGAWLRLLVGALQLIGKAPYVGFFRIAELEDRIERAGFEIVETGDYPANPPSHFVVARKR